MSNRITCIGAVLVLTLAVACQGTKGDRPVTLSDTAVAKENKSLMRLVNAIPSKNPIDVTGDGQALFTGIDYKSVTPYQPVRDNLEAFRIRGPAGKDSVLAESHETMMDGNRYTIVALPDKNGGMRLRIMRDEVVVDSTKVRIRFINAAPDIGKIDLALQGHRESMFKGVSYTSDAGYQEISPTTASLDIRSNGRAKHSGTLIGMKFEGGKAYTIVLMGWGTKGIEAVTFDDTDIGGELSMASGH